MPMAQMAGGAGGSYLLSKPHGNWELEMWFPLAVEATNVNIHYPGLAGGYSSSIAPMMHLNKCTTSKKNKKSSRVINIVNE